MSTTGAQQAQQPAASDQGQPQSNGASGTPIFGKYKDMSEAEKGYKELESKLGELGTRAKVADSLDQYGGLDSVLQWAKYGATEYQKAQQKGSQQPQPTIQQGDPFDGWDMLSPREQAQRVTSATKKEITDYVNQLAQQYSQQVQQNNQQLNQQWDIYRKVMAYCYKHPGSDPDAVMAGMVKIATGNTDSLLEMAAQGLTAKTDNEAQAKALFEQWKADEEQKRLNEQMNVLTGTTMAPGLNRETMPKNARDEKSLVIRKLLESGQISPGAV